MATITRFNPAKYSGKWYQLARIPFKWDQGCMRAEADYTVNQDGTINLSNTCYPNANNNDGAYVRSGIARIPDMSQPGKLQIKFTDGLPSDTNENADVPDFVRQYMSQDQTSGDYWAPYWIHWTDYDNYAIVGGPSKTFLWILSRRPTISKAKLKELGRYVQSLGYNLDHIRFQPFVLQHN